MKMNAVESKKISGSDMCYDEIIVFRSIRSKGTSDEDGRNR